VIVSKICLNLLKYVSIVFHIALFNFESYIKINGQYLLIWIEKENPQNVVCGSKSLRETEESYNPYQLHKMMWKSHLPRSTL
jgi:hypothetical protein